MKERKMTNIKDLAKMAGVSVSTVSRVLNNYPFVKEEKRMAVLKAIKDSNYQININAVHLSKGKTQMIGVVLPYSDYPYFALILKGIAIQANKHNYKLILFQTDYIVSREMEALQMLKQKQIDALIICSRSCDWSIIEEHLPFGPIVLCENLNEKEVSTTFVNHYKIFYKALKYLYQKGHRKIGYCVGRRSGPSSIEREAAYKDFISQNQLPYNPNFVFDNCSHIEDGEKVVNLIKAMDTPPTALLVTNDQAAAGIVATCQKEHISVPDQLAIIGFNNQPIAEIMNITTIEIPLVDIGNQLFLQAVSDEISKKEFEVKFIERGTI
ncbi:LacI family DNA-binding transcriptional regulator [Neobacillus cucumis]|uniref:LacI family DNA-binding transcriptional regulator n=1 Tax=Neobacillus cucumis TaxID=1740721 RepID=UPI00285370ED|nr:LacI family DNA-binding transcriptional regulator [Neobacillus cucumis]MDR4947659.1 LacI family DNA-binding transcriptional regulator [Neobacillus cucumis]